MPSRRLCLAAVTVALAVSACGSDPGTTATGPVASAPLDGVTGELIVTRQRDLLDRGLINVLTRNESGQDLLLTERQLMADFFSTTPTRPRTTSLRDGRQVAVQVPYGTVDDCDSTDPVTATLDVEFIDGPGIEQTGSVPLAGTDILDEIRAEQCASIVFAETTDVTLSGATVTSDGALSVLLEIVPADQNGQEAVRQTIEITDVGGTVLVAADAEPGSLPVAVGAEAIQVPVAFTVNRCDPHALAEVTKRYGLDVYVSIDGAPPEPVSVDVSALTPDLESIVQLCVDRTG